MSDFEWDEKKRLLNLSKHAIDFECIADFEWEKAVTFEDKRYEYGEDRRIALAYLNNDIYACAFTVRDIDIRIISLRKANKKERKIYAQEHYDQGR